MTFLAHRPAPALLGLVDSAHGYAVPAMPEGVHRGLPSRHITLVVELSRPLRISGPAGGIAAHGVLGGLHTAPVHIDASSPQEGIQYGLSPLGCQTLLGVPAGELAGALLDLEDVLGRRPAAELLERVAMTDDWAERFRLLDAALVARLADASARRRSPAERDPALREAWRLVFSSGGRVPVRRLAEHVGYSRRHLSERFRRTTGVTPKQASRIARFESARSLLLAPERPSLAETAAACGFADQAHLAREWRELAGCTVTTWLREELPILQDTAPAREPSSAS